MFCKNCGKEINDNAVVCPHCGVQVGKVETSSDGKKNNMALIGFILSFFIAIAGLICSIIGYKRAKEEGLDGKGMALAGIIISAIEIGFAVIIYIIVSGGSCAALGGMV